MPRQNIWISDSDFKKSPNQMYRAYIFNFQEDMWKYVYNGRDHLTGNHDKAAKRFFRVMKDNRKAFMNHLKDPDDLAVIDYHVQMIEVWMNSLLDDFGFKDKNSVFYLRVKRVHDEFAS